MVRPPNIAEPRKTSPLPPSPLATGPSVWTSSLRMSTLLNSTWVVYRNCNSTPQASNNFPTFPKFPDYSLTDVKFPDFSRFSRSVVTLYAKNDVLTHTETNINAYSGLTVASFSQLFVGSFSTITQILSKTVHMFRTRSTIFSLLALFVKSAKYKYKYIRCWAPVKPHIFTIFNNIVNIPKTTKHTIIFITLTSQCSTDYTAVRAMIKINGKH